MIPGHGRRFASKIECIKYELALPESANLFVSKPYFCSVMSVSFQSIFKSRVLLHIAGWSILFAAPLLLSPPREFNAILNDSANLQSLLMRNVLLMFLFYFNLLYLTPVVLKKNGVAVFILLLVSGVVVVSLVNWQLHHWLAEPFGPDPRRFPLGPRGLPAGPPPMMMTGPLFTSFLITTMIASISTSIVLWNDWVKVQSEERERAFQKVASELAVLKLQISPHFLFNTLNNIRWLVRSRSDKAEEAVVKLSGMLRYILYQTEQETILLGKEIENLKDYITLQKMRLTGQENLSVSFVGDSGTHSIVPLLFIPLVENVFKYGDFSGSFRNYIQLIIDQDQLLFITENLVLPAQPDEERRGVGIGLANIRKRLELHYPDRHRLEHIEKDGIFKVELQLFLR